MKPVVSIRARINASRFEAVVAGFASFSHAQPPAISGTPSGCGDVFLDVFRRWSLARHLRLLSANPVGFGPPPSANPVGFSFCESCRFGSPEVRNPTGLPDSSRRSPHRGDLRLNGKRKQSTPGGGARRTGPGVQMKPAFLFVRESPHYVLKRSWLDLRHFTRPTSRPFLAPLQGAAMFFGRFPEVSLARHLRLLSANPVGFGPPPSANPIGFSFCEPCRVQILRHAIQFQTVFCGGVPEESVRHIRKLKQTFVSILVRDQRIRSRSPAQSSYSGKDSAAFTRDSTPLVVVRLGVFALG
jgi:hypothetical protein